MLRIQSFLVHSVALVSRKIAQSNPAELGTRSSNKKLNLVWIFHLNLDKEIWVLLLDKKIKLVGWWFAGDRLIREVSALRSQANANIQCTSLLVPGSVDSPEPICRHYARPGCGQNTHHGWCRMQISPCQHRPESDKWLDFESIWSTRCTCCEVARKVWINSEIVIREQESQFNCSLRLIQLESNCHQLDSAWV